MQLFTAVGTMFFKKSKIAHENMKKPPSKVAHNRPPPQLSFMYRPKCPNGPI